MTEGISAGSPKKAASPRPRGRRIWSDPMRTLYSILLASLLVVSCAKKTADVELNAARDAINSARSKKAGDCDESKPQYQAAEAAIAEAQKLAEEGDVEGAKARALEAKTLAEQANAAARPDCDKKAEQEEQQQDQDEDDAPAPA